MATSILTRLIYQIFILHSFKNTQGKHNQRFVLVLLPNHTRVNLRLWWNIILNRSSRFISGAPYTRNFFCKKEIPSRLLLRKVLETKAVKMEAWEYLSYGIKDFIPRS